jgi:hypothetical protein
LFVYFPGKHNKKTNFKTMFSDDKVTSTTTVIIPSYPTMTDQVNTQELAMTSLMDSKQEKKTQILHTFLIDCNVFMMSTQDDVNTG